MQLQFQLGHPFKIPKDKLPLYCEDFNFYIYTIYIYIYTYVYTVLSFWGRLYPKIDNQYLLRTCPKSVGWSIWTHADINMTENYFTTVCVCVFAVCRNLSCKFYDAQPQHYSTPDLRRFNLIHITMISPSQLPRLTPKSFTNSQKLSENHLSCSTKFQKIIHHPPPQPCRVTAPGVGR